MIDARAKVQAEHQKRNAYLYIRQSTPRQVLEHQESTQRQYGLRQQALRLGWAEEQIVVIDTDLEPRVKAHVMVAFLGYALWVTLKPGDESLGKPADCRNRRAVRPAHSAYDCRCPNADRVC